MSRYMYIKYSKHITLLIILLSTLLFSFRGSVKTQSLELYADALHFTKQTDREYKKDAARLALSHVAKGRSLLDIDIFIPKDIQESLFNALIYIRNSQDTHARKVTGMGIHTQAKPYYIDRIEINCNAEATWVEPLIEGSTVTASEKINKKLAEYELEIIDYNKERNSFIVSARNPLNMRKLAQILSKYDNGIDFITIPEINITDHDIEAKHVEGNTWIITFQNGGKKWSFRVDETGGVLYPD